MLQQAIQNQDAMNENEQRTTIAEACGWQPPLSHNSVLWTRKDEWADTAHLPDYLHDLNAMHKAVESLPVDQRHTFCEFLTAITSKETPFNWRGFAFANATAAQRAEAFLKTIGKWKD